ncbi:GNAT family N-acetyltransferase [Filobacillus milosensis]|uniref:GNAT family N-acetyltransferase n=1 Tax=Filobacillus milosensis TaxID=94137 RepID=A0A4Y8IQF7_9BACI|nr:GNAT family N-acetyltransferase [Filobacillus milosensis]TFB22906.1 GNAT family N-acetyltransferase [Filobacillus milosensis]
MTNKITIRKAIQNDIPYIQKVAKETWHNTYDGLIPREIQDEFISRAYSDETMKAKVEHSILFVAELKGEIVGYSNFFTDGERADLGAIYILPHAQGKGVGTMLLDAGIKELKQFDRIFVEVEKGNTVGEQFYEAKGFELIEEYDEDFFGYMLKTKRMALNI